MCVKTILIVEDEFLLAMHLQQLLEDDGWRVLGPVACVSEAIALLELEVPALALLDVNLGSELVTPVAIRLRQLGVPFALASAYDRPEQHAGEVLAGAPNVGKPTSTHRLLATVNRMLEAR